MVEKLEHYKELAEKMIKQDEKRNLANDDYDKMDHNEWAAPSNLRDLDWFRKYISTDPSDAINAGTRVLSALDERLTLQPVADNQDTKNRANEIERALKWVMSQVDRRRQGSVVRSVVRSALKYDEVIAQVVDLDEQIKSKEIFEGDTKREKAARRFGRFMVIIHHPNNVHVMHSNLMPEAVLLAHKRKAKEVLKEWGNMAGTKLKQAAEDDREVKYFDYMDYDVHVVWIEDKMGGQEEEILREEHNIPFLPWVARVGGDTMESDSEHRRRPMLYPVRTSGSWQTQNLLQSLKVSEAIAYSAAPRLKEEGPQIEKTTEVDYGSPGRVAQVTPQNVLTPLPPPGIDPALHTISLEIQQAITKSTVSNILQGGDVPSGTAFATLNLATQTAVGALKPAKELAEFAIADIYTLFLLWMTYTKKNIEAYGTDKYSDAGKQYTIEWDEVDPQNIYLNVELTPDVPLDRQQRANVAMGMVQAGIYSKERAMEDMGITDPDNVMKEVLFEQLLQAEIQRMIQMQAYQDQQALVAQQAAQQQAMASIQSQMAGAPGGNGFNPALGGQPPAEVAPGATREGVTGQTMTGEETGFQGGGL